MNDKMFDLISSDPCEFAERFEEFVISSETRDEFSGLNPLFALLDSSSRCNAETKRSLLPVIERLLLKGVSPVDKGRDAFIFSALPKSLWFSDEPDDIFPSFFLSEKARRFFPHPPKESSDKHGTTYLMTAVRCEYSHLIDMLLDEKTVKDRASGGINVLTYVKSADMASRLIKAGADTSVKNDAGEDLLIRLSKMAPSELGGAKEKANLIKLCLDNVSEDSICCAAEKDKKTLETLLKRTSDVNLLNSKGISPLFSAVKAGKQPNVELLLSKGARPDFPNADGKLPYSAVSIDDVSILEALVKHSEGWNNESVLSVSRVAARPWGVSFILDHAKDFPVLQNELADEFIKVVSENIRKCIDGGFSPQDQFFSSKRTGVSEALSFLGESRKNSFLDDMAVLCFIHTPSYRTPPMDVLRTRVLRDGWGASCLNSLSGDSKEKVFKAIAMIQAEKLMIQHETHKSRCFHRGSV